MGGLIRRNLDTFNFALAIFANIKVARVFAVDLKSSKTLGGLVYFVLHGDFAGSAHSTGCTALAWRGCGDSISP